jgi:hypothetical protein
MTLTCGARLSVSERVRDIEPRDKLGQRDHGPTGRLGRAGPWERVGSREKIIKRKEKGAGPEEMDGSAGENGPTDKVGRWTAIGVLDRQPTKGSTRSR